MKRNSNEVDEPVATRFWKVNCLIVENADVGKGLEQHAIEEKPGTYWK